MKSPRVVSYVRMSDDKQENSPERQRKAIREYATKRGYTVGHEYFDAGISGWRDDRPGFNRMLADAKAKKFDVILVDQGSRLSRDDDPFQFIALVVYPLKKTGVTVDCADTGVMNWNDLGGQVMTVVNADQNAKEVQNLSYRVLGGMVQKAKAGMWQGAAPFGYKVHRVTDPDNPTKVTDRYLVPGASAHVEAVKWVFAEYASGRRGKAAIAAELAKRGIFSPRKDKSGQPKPFTTEAVRWMLMNRAYLGEFRWNRKTEGKFHKFTGGRAEKKTEKQFAFNDEADWIVVPQRHQALIDLETFQAVQERLNGNAAPSTPHADGGQFKLPKLLTCGMCGAWMYGFTAKPKSDNPERRYVCGTYNQQGKGGKCYYNTVSETGLVRAIAKKIQAFFTNPDVLNQVRAEVARQEAQQQDPAVRAELVTRLGELNRRVSAGEARLLELPADMLAGAVNALRALKEERDGVSAELAKIDAQTKPTEHLEKTVTEITSRMWHLADVMERGEPMDVRAALSLLIERVELQFTARKTAKTTRTTLTGGFIHLRQPETPEVPSQASPSY